MTRARVLSFSIKAGVLPQVRRPFCLVQGQRCTFDTGFWPIRSSRTFGNCQSERKENEFYSALIWRCKCAFTLECFERADASHFYRVVRLFSISLLFSSLHTVPLVRLASLAAQEEIVKGLPTRLQIRIIWAQGNYFPEKSGPKHFVRLEDLRIFSDFESREPIIRPSFLLHITLFFYFLPIARKIHWTGWFFDREREKIEHSKWRSGGKINWARASTRVDFSTLAKKTVLSRIITWCFHNYRAQIRSKLEFFFNPSAA